MTITKLNSPATVGAVAKSGDTMTGVLHIQSSNIDRDGANPSSDTYGQYLRLSDKDDEIVGLVRPCRGSGGLQYLQLAAYNEKTDGTAVSNFFQIIMDRSGNPSYWVSSPAAFCSAINAVQYFDGVVAKNSSTTIQMDLGSKKCMLLQAGTWNFMRVSIISPNGSGGMLRTVLHSNGNEMLVPSMSNNVLTLTNNSTSYAMPYKYIWLSS